MAIKQILWLTVFLLIALGLVWLQLSINREVVSDITVLNPEGKAGSALVAYHPGLSDFMQTVTLAFTDGLIASDWRVELTTISRETPAELADYDLLALGVHTYWWAPDAPTRRYLKRLGDLADKPTAVLLTALGQAGRSGAKTTALIEEHNGELAKLLTLYTLRPNDDDNPSRPNREVAVEMAFKAASELVGLGAD